MALKLDKTMFLVTWTKTDSEEEPGRLYSDHRVSTDAFKNDTTLKEVKIHENAKEICDGAFEGYTSLTKVEFPELIDIIHRFAFYGCTALETIVIPDSVKRIECWMDRRVASVTLYRPFSQKKLIEHLISGCGETEFYLCEEDYRSWRDWN